MTFIATPFIVNRLGDTEYGLLVTLTALVGYFSALDLDLATGVSKYVAEFNSAGKQAETRCMVSTALAIVVALGACVAFVLLLSSGWIVGTLVNVEETSQGTAQLILVLFGLSFIFSLVSWVYGGVLTGMHRFDMLSWVSFAQVIVYYGTITWLLSAGFGLLAVAVFQAVEPLGVMVAFYLLARRVSPSVVPLPAYHPETARKLLKFSTVTMAGKLARGSTRRFDRILIGALASPAAVTQYVVACMPVLLLVRLTALLERMTVPLASELHSVDSGRLGELYLRGTRLTTLASILVFVPSFVFAGELLNIWMGPTYAESGALVLRAVLIGSLAISTTSIGGSILVGSGTPSPYSIGSIATAVVVVPLYVVLIPYWGIEGAALGFAVPHVLFTILFSAYVLRRLSLGVADFLLSTLAPLGTLVLAGIGTGRLVRFLVEPVTDWLTLSSAMGSTFCATLILGAILRVLKAEDYSAIGHALHGHTSQRIPQSQPRENPI